MYYLKLSNVKLNADQSRWSYLHVIYLLFYSFCLRRLDKMDFIGYEKYKVSIRILQIMYKYLSF